jgi:hypothetical protein
VVDGANSVVGVVVAVQLLIFSEGLAALPVYTGTEQQQVAVWARAHRRQRHSNYSLSLDALVWSVRQ